MSYTVQGRPLICWRVREAEERWLFDPFKEPSGNYSAQPRGREDLFPLDHLFLEELPPSEHVSLEALKEDYPDGFMLCSPRVWATVTTELSPSL